MIDSKKHTTPTRILLVDDEREILDLLTSILSGGGYEIYRASDGAQALQRIGEMSFDLIITDCKMPRMTGMEFYNQAKQLSPGIDKRFLFLSAEIIPERNLAFAKESGARVISKPFRIEEMQRVVRELLASGAADYASPDSSPEFSRITMQSPHGARSMGARSRERLSP